MVEKDNVIKESLRFAGISDFKGAYDHAWQWLVREKEYDLQENKYAEKVKGDSKEIDLKWTATKKMTDYFKSKIEISWIILGMSDVEVEIDGKKKKMQKFAEIRIDIKGVLEKDYDSKWEGSRMQKFWKDVYHKYVIPARIEEKQAAVAAIATGFKNEMKSYLDLTGIA